MLLMAASLSGMAQDPTLEAYVPFDGDVNYAAGNALGSPVSNFGATFTTDRNGNPNSALLLDGSSAYVDYGDLANFRMGSDDFTIMVWMKGDPTQSGSGIVVGKRALQGSVDPSYAMQWTATNQQLLAYYRDDQGFANVWPNPVVTANQWRHVAMVFDRQAVQLRVYIDGVQAAATSLGNLSTFNASGSMFGQLVVGRSGIGAQYFRGSVDDLYIFRKALTQAEIAAYADCSTITAPTATTQTFCSLDNPTIGDLTATADGTLNWYFASTGGSPLPTSFPISSGGTYYVSQSVAECESPRQPVTVQVNTSPGPPTASAQTFCAFSNPTVNDLQASGAGIISWYDDAQSSVELLTGETLATGTYYARQTINGCTSNPRQVEVTVNVTPAPTAVDQSFCNNSNATVADLVASGTGAIGWFDLNQSFDPLAPSTPLQTGTYSVVQVIDNCPSAFVEVDVTILPIVPAPTTFPSVQFCEGTTVSELSTQASGVGTFSWYDSELSTTPLNETEVLETGLGFYYVSQTVNGCESERASMEVEVIPNPGAPVLVSEQTFCNTQNATVADLNTNGQPIVWHLGPASFDFLSANTPLVDGTTYYAQLGVPCATDRSTVAVSFFSVDNSVTIANGSITANQLNATYEWFFCIDGFTSIGVTDPSFSPTDPFGAYAVVVTYQGCSATSDCIASSIVVGVDEAESNSFTAFPNPTSGIVQFSAAVSGQLMDASGRRIMNISNTMEMDISDLPQGLYVLRTDDGANIRLMKQ